MIPRRCVISGSHVDAQGTITPAGGAAHMLREDLVQPWPDRGCHGVKISLQAVVARHVVLPHGEPFAVLGFTVSNGKIVEIDVVADPERLRHLDLTALDG